MNKNKKGWWGNTTHHPTTCRHRPQKKGKKKKERRRGEKMAWEEIRVETRKEAEPWDYHEKVSLEGRVELKKENTDHEGRKYLTVILETDEGERYFLPRNVDLQLKLKDVEEGDKLHIRHAGEEELPDGRTIRRFKVYRWVEA